MNSSLLDTYDLRLLSALQQDDARSLQSLAELVSLSPSQCSRRICRLKARGFIRKQVTLLNPRAIGVDVEAYITVCLDQHTSDSATNFKEAVLAMAAIMECYAITGSNGDYLLKVVARNQEALSLFLLEELMKIPGVSQIKTAVALSTIKSTTALPLGLL